MKKEQLLFVPLVGKTSACRQKEGLKQIKDLLLLPRLTAVLPPQGWEMSRGFTLIELLVVVLIIGILAAIAVPQYQKAVLKSRYSTLMPVAKTVANGQEIHYMDKGTYASTIDNLDIKVPSGGVHANIEVNEDTGERPLEYVLTSRDDVRGLAYAVYQKHSPLFADTTMCEANDTLNSKATWLCQTALHGTPVESGSLQGKNWTAYLLTGTLREGDAFPAAEVEEVQPVTKAPAFDGEEYESCESEQDGMCMLWCKKGEDEISEVCKDCRYFQDGTCLEWTTVVKYGEEDATYEYYECTDFQDGTCVEWITLTTDYDGKELSREWYSCNGDVQDGVCLDWEKELQDDKGNYAYSYYRCENYRDGICWQGSKYEEDLNGNRISEEYMCGDYQDNVCLDWTKDASDSNGNFSSESYACHDYQDGVCVYGDYSFFGEVDYWTRYIENGEYVSASGSSNGVGYACRVEEGNINTQTGECIEP